MSSDSGSGSGIKRGNIKSNIDSKEEVPVKKLKPDVKIEWNNKSKKDYLKKSFELIDLPGGAFIVDGEVERFLHEVDISKVPIQRTVSRMIRIKAIDYSSPKLERKEFIYYFEHWNHLKEVDNCMAKNYQGKIIAPVIDHIEGRWNESLVTEYEEENFDESNGETTVTMKKRFDGVRVRYDIPFSKERVDDIIEKSAHSDKDNIRFMVKIEGANHPTGYGAEGRVFLTYDQFTNWSWEQLFKFACRPPEKNIDMTKPNETRRPYG